MVNVKDFLKLGILLLIVGRAIDLLGQHYASVIPEGRFPIIVATATLNVIFLLVFVFKLFEGARQRAYLEQLKGEIRRSETRKLELETEIRYAQQTRRY